MGCDIKNKHGGLSFQRVMLVQKIVANTNAEKSSYSEEID